MRTTCCTTRVAYRRKTRSSWSGLGRAADATGHTREAIDALTTYLSLVDPAKANTEAAGRLGIIYLRLGELDDAIRYLRLGLHPLKEPVDGQITVALADALVARGEMTGAIETLVDALAATGGNYYSREASLVAFSLAVMYDRDDQRSAAFEILDHMQTAMQTSYPTELQQVLGAQALAVPDDEPYYLALFYESVGLYAEARTEWTIYAAIPDAPWRARALEHVVALDDQRRSAKPTTANATSRGLTPAMPIPRRYRPAGVRP